MKVYVALKGIKYEGETIIGVFTNPWLAKAAIKKAKSEWYDYYFIDEFELDKEDEL
jgi:hypothetical protein